MVDEITDMALEACFNAKERKDCSACMAHPLYEGTCCFGDPDMFAEFDDDCDACPWQRDCRLLSTGIAKARAEAAKRRQRRRLRLVKG